MNIIQTEAAPKAIGVLARHRGRQVLFSSGQIPLTAAGELVNGDIEAQPNRS
jgi:2-iminobutanoate/2-iminopropanoate deaminase